MIIFRFIEYYTNIKTNNRSFYKKHEDFHIQNFNNSLIQNIISFVIKKSIN